MEKIGILGGSFSPVHNAHLQIAQDCLDKFCLDKIIFLPNANPPHKRLEIFSYEDRVKMLHLAISNEKYFEISNLENDKNKIHYSYNTVNENFKNEDVYFIMGDDEFLDIRSWYNYEKFLQICKIIVFCRNHTLNYIIKKNKDLIEKHDINFVENKKISISSTDIRYRIKNKLSIKYLVPKEVYNYIYNDLNFFDISKIKEDLKKKLKESRYYHCLRVADYCKFLAKIYGVDENKAYICGLLHDCAKNNEQYYLLNKKISSDIIFDKEEKDNKFLWHSLIGAVVSKKIYGVLDDEIFSAIRFHTTAKENMTLLEKILFISDKIEPKRDYPEVNHLRKIVVKDIDLAIIEFLDSNFKYLQSKGQKVHSLSIKAKKYLESMR